MQKRVDFSFDERIVKLYNRQRQHPADVSEQIGAAIHTQTPENKRLLEMGIGTGRIGWPAAAAGVDVIGFDLSPHMLGEVYQHSLEKIAGSLAITQADMHHLPFRQNSFGAVLAVHVLHLATDWQQVLREAVRVLQPDGVLIQGDDWIDPESVVGRLRNELRRHAVRLNPDLMPPAAGISKAQFLSDLGGTDKKQIVAAEWTTHLSPNERLAAVEQRIDAESWILSDDLFEKMLIHLRDYAAKLWPDLDAQQPVKRRFILNMTRGDWQMTQ